MLASFLLRESRKRGERVDELIKMIKKKMVEKGRDDFVNYLSELLNISKQWASAKMSGKTSFSDLEIATLNKELDFDSEELAQVLKC